VLILNQEQAAMEDLQLQIFTLLAAIFLIILGYLLPAAAPVAGWPWGPAAGEQKVYYLNAWLSCFNY
jgi:hypothetical protein